MRKTIVFIKAIFIYMIITLSTISQAQDEVAIEEWEATAAKVDRMGQICNDRKKLIAKDDPQFTTISACSRSCLKIAKIMQMASERRARTMKLVPQCEDSFNSLSEEYQQDTSAQLAAKEKLEKSAVETIELGDIEGKLQSLRNQAGHVRTAVLESTHTEFNTLCKGRASGIGGPKLKRRGEDAILKDVQYINHNTPNAIGKCKFGSILIKD